MVAQDVKKYYLFIDESGDHGLVNLDESFPVFLLCGLLTSEENYIQIRDDINELKNDFGMINKLFFILGIFVNVKKNFKFYLT